jgi:2-polyprenyl-3-methyl-5-hydroxy-6-metoxy-1,4-benzoquinol methylase
MEMFLPASDAEGERREIFETIRRYVSNGASETESPADVSNRDMMPDAASMLRESVRLLRLTHDLVGQMPPQPPTMRGRIGAWIIRQVRRALFWYTPQILEFHRITTDVIEKQARAIEEINGILGEIRRDLAQEIAARKGIEAWARSEIAELGEGFKSALTAQAERTDAGVERAVAGARALLEQVRTAMEDQIRVDAKRIQAVEGRLGDNERKIFSFRQGLISQEMRLSVLLEEARKRMDQMGAGQLAGLVREDAHRMDAMYLTFEDQFRGTREEIQDSFRAYLPILKSHGIGGPEMPLLDVGCGRGEWLEILRQEGMSARGVDANRLMLTECRTRQLNVVESDAVEHLRSLEAESLGGVTGFHVIEHLPFPCLVDLLDETVRVLKPGGVAIFETPNPGNVIVGTEHFYLDPTHHNPLPSLLTRFLAEERGLCRVEVLELHPCPDGVRVAEQGCAVAERFNQLFYGPQDYAIIGWKV